MKMKGKPLPYVINVTSICVQHTLINATITKEIYINLTQMWLMQGWSLVRLKLNAIYHQTN